MFFVDDVNGEAPLDRPELDVDEQDDEDGASGSEDEESGDEDSQESGESDESDDEDEDEDQVEVDTHKIASTSTSATGRKAPAWTDPDDANLNVSLASNRRLRKLRDAASEDAVGGKEYERRLRRQFEKINPTPEWATKARTKLHPSSKQKRRRPSISSSDEESRLGDDDLPELLASTGGILGQRPKTLQSGTLSIERLRDANLSARSEGAIKAVQFHPSSQIPVMLTAGEDRRLRLFNVSFSVPRSTVVTMC